MNHLSKLFLSLLLYSNAYAFAFEENFILINGITNEIVLELGQRTNERVSPCSTFKITLSLIGYDAGILKDKENPVWNYQQGYDDWLDSWKAPQSPYSWMKNSCVWYSRVIAAQLGSERMQSYLKLLEYGNQDMSGGLTTAWIISSLKISPKEQVYFIQKMINGTLPVSVHAIQMTKDLLFLEELSEGWNLFGKTGTGENGTISWLVGWIEKDQASFSFAYNIYDKEMSRAERILRVKELLNEFNYRSK